MVCPIGCVNMFANPHTVEGAVDCINTKFKGPHDPGSCSNDSGSALMWRGYGDKIYAASIHSSI